MYIPACFEEPRINVMHELIRAYPLATLVTLSSTGLDGSSREKAAGWISRDKKRDGQSFTVNKKANSGMFFRENRH